MTYQTDEKHLNNMSEYFVGVVIIAFNRYNNRFLLSIKLAKSSVTKTKSVTVKTLKMSHFKSFRPTLACTTPVLSRLVHCATLVRDSATHSGIVGCEGSVWRIAPLRFLTARSFLGAPIPELLLCAPFLRVHPAALVAIAAQTSLARAFSFVHSTQVGGVTR